MKEITKNQTGKYHLKILITSEDIEILQAIMSYGVHVSYKDIFAVALRDFAVRYGFVPGKLGNQWLGAIVLEKKKGVQYDKRNPISHYQVLEKCIIKDCPLRDRCQANTPNYRDEPAANRFMPQLMIVPSSDYQGEWEIRCNTAYKNKQNGSDKNVGKIGKNFCVGSHGSSHEDDQ